MYDVTIRTSTNTCNFHGPPIIPLRLELGAVLPSSRLMGGSSEFCLNTFLAFHEPMVALYCCKDIPMLLSSEQRDYMLNIITINVVVKTGLRINPLLSSLIA